MFSESKAAPNILNKTSAAEAKGQIVKNFGFSQILWPLVDHSVFSKFGQTSPLPVVFEKKTWFD